MRRGMSNRSSGKSNNNSRVQPGLSSELPPVETVIARLETLTKLLHESSQTRQGSVYLEIQALSDDLRKLGPYLEQAYPDVLDRVMASMRDASASASLPPSLRLAVFELVELRAAKWSLPSDTFNYYQQRRILKDGNESGDLMNPVLGISPFPIAIPSPNTNNSPSGEHPPPTPLKAYRQEIVIKNSDSGKVMGVRGRRISKIEKLSDTIISFEKVDPCVKERILSINGYSQQSINLAKKLIQDTIARNASPIFNGSASAAVSGGTVAAGTSTMSLPMATTSAPSLIITNSLLGQPQLDSVAGTGVSPSLALPELLQNCLNNNNNNDDGISSNFDPLDNFLNNNNCPGLDSLTPAFNYTVNVGDDVVRVSGNDLTLVQEAKLALDDYFAQKYPQMFYTMHVRTRTTSLNAEDQDDNSNCSVDNNIRISPAFRYDNDFLEKSDIKPLIIYNREKLLSLADKCIRPPDFSQLDPSTKEMIVLKKPRALTFHMMTTTVGNGTSEGASSSFH